jgi:hypothetical protein
MPGPDILAGGGRRLGLMPGEPVPLNQWESKTNSSEVTANGDRRTTVNSAGPVRVISVTVS